MQNKVYLCSKQPYSFEQSYISHSLFLVQSFIIKIEKKNFGFDKLFKVYGKYSLLRRNFIIISEYYEIKWLVIKAC